MQIILHSLTRQSMGDSNATSVRRTTDTPQLKPDKKSRRPTDLKLKIPSNDSFTLRTSEADFDNNNAPQRKSTARRPTNLPLNLSRDDAGFHPGRKFPSMYIEDRRASDLPLLPPSEMDTEAPPDYLNASYGYVTTVVPKMIPDRSPRSSPVVTSIELGSRPIHVTCPSCCEIIKTRVKTETGSLTHFAALLLCCLGCICCFWYPYIEDSCKNKNHYCPKCEAYIGRPSKRDM